MTNAGHMNPNLVGSSRFQLTFYVRKTAKALQDAVMGDRIAAILLINAHLLAVSGVASNGGMNRSGFVL